MNIKHNWIENILVYNFLNVYLGTETEGTARVQYARVKIKGTDLLPENPLLIDLKGQTDSIVLQIDNTGVKTVIKEVAGKDSFKYLYITASYI